MILTTPAPERYTRFSCPNPYCAQFNRPGTGHIRHRSWTGKDKHIERLRCTVCGCEFSERAGTLMARSKLPEATVERLLKSGTTQPLGPAPRLARPPVNPGR